MSEKEELDYKYAFLRMCAIFAAMMEGNNSNVSEGYELMREYGVTDENDEIIYYDE